MLVSDFVPATFLIATGKQATFTTGSSKWLKIIALGNIFIDQWAEEPGVEWNSLYSPEYSIGTVTASQTFAIPTTVRKISQQETDVVRIYHTNGINYTDYQTIDPEMMHDSQGGTTTFLTDTVTITGRTLRFSRAFTANDPQFGGTIKVPAYTYPAHVTADSDTIPVDIPNWLVFMTAAEYVRSDVTRQNQYPALLSQANDIMERMKENNASQDTTVLTSWNPVPLYVGQSGDGFNA